MPDLTVSSDIDTFMTSADNATARSNLGVTSSISTAVATETASRIEADNRSAKAGGVYFGDPVSSTLNKSGGVAFGLGNFSIYKKVTLNMTAAESILFFDSHSSGNNRLYIIFGANSLTVRFYDDVGAITNYQITGLSLGDLGGNFQLQIAGDRGGLATLYANGVDVGSVDISGSSDVNIGDGNTSAARMKGSETATNGHVTLSDLAIANFAPTATQAAEIAAEGVEPWFARHPEYQRGLVADESLFDSGLNGWALTAGNESVTFTHDVNKSSLVVTVAGTRGNRPYISKASITASGFNYLVSIDYTVNSGTCIFQGHFGQTGGLKTIPLTGSGVYHYPILSNEISSNLILYFLGTNTFDLDINSIRITKLGALSINPLDDAGYQKRDVTGNGNHLLASATGVYPLVSKDEGKVSGSGLNGDVGTAYLLRAGNVLPENVVVTGVAVDGVYHAADGAQDQTYRRIAFVTSASNVLIQRHNGTTAQTIATATPTSTANFSLTVYFKAL